MNPPETQEREFFTLEEIDKLKETRPKDYEQIMADAREYVKQAEIDDRLNELEARLQSEKAGLEKRVTEKLALLEEFRKKKQQEE
jgi:hypothetical protein